MIQLSQEEANKLLNQYIYYRNKVLNGSKSQKFYDKYKYYEQLCEEKFDYLVNSKLSKYKQFSNYDDLKQDGRIALLSALRSFNPQKGNFFYWANRYIITKIKREANNHSVFHIPIKHAKNNHPYKESKLPILVDSYPDALQIAESNEKIKTIRNAIESLPDEQKKVIELNGIKLYSISKISKELKIARAECARLLNEAKETLKNQLILTI